MAAKYREKVYYLSSTEARDKFLADPEEFLPKNSSPKVRFSVYFLSQNIETTDANSSRI